MDWMMWIVPVAAGAIVMALLWRNYRLHKNCLLYTSDAADD